MVAQAAAKIAASYLASKGKNLAMKAGKKILKKGLKAGLGALGGASNNHNKAAVPAANPRASKVHKKMIDKGMTKEKETQVGAYIPSALGSAKRGVAASGMAAFPTRKLLTANRALSYSGEATMKTRL